MKKKPQKKMTGSGQYTSLLRDIQRLIGESRRQAARTINTIMTATYWEVGRRIVVFEQNGQKRAGYGKFLLKKLSGDLTEILGRGFSERNLEQMRLFYQWWPLPEISQTVSAKSDLRLVARKLPLSWSHYSRLLRVKIPQARNFYEAESLRGGWSVRQLDRQIDSQFYERMALSKDKSAMMKKGIQPKAGDKATPEGEVKNPYVLEFLGLKDEYSETELEEGLIHHLESFLMELGGDFTFVARQKRLRVGHAWYRIDLVFYHRRLRCLVLVDLKIGHFTHADAGQMHLYLNYARENWTHRDENPPVGLILCAEKDDAVAKYALEGLHNKVLAAEYKTALPNEGELVKEIQRTRRGLWRNR